MKPTRQYTLSLHDALPIWGRQAERVSELEVPHAGLGGAVEAEKSGPERDAQGFGTLDRVGPRRRLERVVRSEEHTSELQSLAYLVCRLLLEKKNSFW